MLENESFSSLLPGGLGSLTGLVRIKKAQASQPQFSLIGRVAIISRCMAV